MNPFNPHQWVQMHLPSSPPGYFYSPVIGGRPINREIIITEGTENTEADFLQKDLRYKKSMNKRIDLIDVAKGLSIILVALYHSKLASMFPELNAALGLFRMPLFFFLSGVFFKPVISSGSYVLKKTDALLKPYFATLLFLLLISIFFGHPDVLTDVFGLLYGNGITIAWPPLWFLTHLWLIFIVSYLLFQYMNFDNFSFALKIVLIFTAFGSSSLFILIFHSFICGKLYWLMFYEMRIDSVLFCGGISYLACITLPIVMKYAFRKNHILRSCYFPLKAR